MNDYPLVCICIPHYNNELTISETVDSLLNQTYKNIIIKIFDNASTDNSMAILKKYEEQYSNIQVFQNELNIGGEANFTRCIQNGEGEYTAIFHADDVYLPTMIEKQVSFLEENIACSAVATGAYYINENSKRVGIKFLPNILKTSPLLDSVSLFKMILQYSNFITCPSVMSRTKILKDNIQSWNGEEFYTSADLDVWLRLASYGDFGFIYQPLMEYRKSMVSYSFSTLKFNMKESDMFLVLRHYLSIDTIQQKLTEADMSNYHFLVFKNNLSRTVNYMIKGEKSYLSIGLFSKYIMNIRLISRDRFFIYCAAIIIKVVRNFPLPLIAKNFLLKLRSRS